jgi:NAD(P)-dependent dehydrogenase (short-subunit alcohol dehydrogenase family)
MLLPGKVAIVTGAAQGIGRACAARLAKEGGKVLVCDVAQRQGQEAAAAIVAAGGQASFLACDVARPGDAARAVEAAVQTFGRLDILVNNAGILDDAPFLDLALEDFDRVLSVNLRGAFVMGQAAARRMIAQGRPAAQTRIAPQAGAIVNMSSVNAVFALPDHVAYSISKGGLGQLTKAMAIALAPHGIRVNAVGPGSIDTPLLAGVIKDAAFRQRVLSRTPLGRFGEPEEVAAVVAWLASEEASYVTGTTVFADGGRLPLNYVVATPAT